MRERRGVSDSDGERALGGEDTEAVAGAGARGEDEVWVTLWAAVVPLSASCHGRQDENVRFAKIGLRGATGRRRDALMLETRVWVAL